MLSTELAKAIEEEVAGVNERIGEHEAKASELREYKERLVAFGKGELNGETSAPPKPPAAVKPPPGVRVAAPAAGA